MTPMGDYFGARDVEGFAEDPAYKKLDEAAKATYKPDFIAIYGISGAFVQDHIVRVQHRIQKGKVSEEERDEIANASFDLLLEKLAADSKQKSSL